MEKSDLPHCPEPLGLKLAWQIQFLCKAKSVDEQMILVRAMKDTLDKIWERYNLPEI